MANPTEQEKQIVINDVPSGLVEDIDALAKADDRSRASFVRKLLAEIVAQKKAAAKKQLQPA